MPDIPRVGSLEVDQDLAFEHRLWTVERIGWGLMLLAAVAALVGLLGPGPLTYLTAGPEGGPLWVDYYRFQRVQSPDEIQVHLGPGDRDNREVRLWIDRQYLDNVELEKVTPQPWRVETGPDRLVFVFHRSEPDKTAAVRFRFLPRQPGSQRARVGLEGAAPVEFSQFVYP